MKIWVKRDESVPEIIHVYTEDSAFILEVEEVRGGKDSPFKALGPGEHAFYKIEEWKD